MDNFSEKELTEAKNFTDFYIDLIENHKETIMYYLSETATLDWFGHTVKGEKKIGMFLKSQTASVKHILNTPMPVSTIGYRDTHVINCPAVEGKTRQITINKSPIFASEEKTPPKDLPGSSHSVEQGQGDGAHNFELPVSPAKRLKLGDVVVNESVSYSPVKFVSAEGHVEFRKRSSKKFQRETKWTRPCKLEIAYSSTNIKDSTIHLIIYSNDMKCRRNLLKEFENSELSD